MKKITQGILGVSGLLTSSFLFAQTPQAKFISSIQMAVHESSPVLLERSRQLVAEEFGNTFMLEHRLRGRGFETRNMGNEVVFILTSDEDMRVPVQQVVAGMVKALNGRVDARGKSAFYKAAFPQTLGGYLEVVLDDSHAKILSISAQLVPFRDLLKEIKTQVGGAFSYLIPGECADQVIDWSFGGEADGGQPISVDSAMDRLALLFGLKVQQSGGSYVFTGTCNTPQRRNEGFNQASAELLRNSFFPQGNGLALPISSRQVYVPVMPLGD